MLGTKKASRTLLEDAKGWMIFCKLSVLIECRETQLNGFEAEVRVPNKNIPSPVGRMNSRQEIKADCMDHRTEALTTS